MWNHEEILFGHVRREQINIFISSSYLGYAPFYRPHLLPSVNDADGCRKNELYLRKKFIFGRVTFPENSSTSF